ncbi:MAG: DUF4330 family protein [Clostridiales bacterium]|nr:DUF4330 family protein [Clostridiales bacterium]
MKKWTLIDTLIVLIVAAAAAVGVMKLAPSIGSKENGKVEFTVLLTDKEKGFAEAFGEGDRVTLSLTEKDGGVIKSVSSAEANQMVYNSMTGVYSNIINPDKEDIWIVIEADCTMDDVAIKTGDTAIKVGVDIPIRGKGYATSGYIVDVNDNAEVSE